MLNGKKSMITNNFKYIFFIFILVAIPTLAANSDDEIIKNIDFFQNMEVVKTDNPFLEVLKLDESKNNQSDSNSLEKKQ